MTGPAVPHLHRQDQHTASRRDSILILYFARVRATTLPVSLAAARSRLFRTYILMPQVPCLFRTVFEHFLAPLGWRYITENKSCVSFGYTLFYFKLQLNRVYLKLFQSFIANPFSVLEKRQNNMLRKQLVRMKTFCLFLSENCQQAFEPRCVSPLNIPSSCRSGVQSLPDQLCPDIHRLGYLCPVPLLYQHLYMRFLT